MINLRNLANGATEVRESRDYSPTPDAEGILGKYEMMLPEFTAGAHYAAFQKYDPHPNAKYNWPDGSNRMQPLKFASFDELSPGGLFLLLELTTGSYLAILPLAGKSSLAWFVPAPGKLTIALGTLGTEAVAAGEPLPLYAAACDDNPYVACRRVWEAALPALGYPTRMRMDKRYPDIFRYLGWCSWEQFKKDINEAVFEEAASEIERSDIPIRYMLVDDGYVDATKESALRSFAPVADKFPHGWSKLAALKKPDKIKWLGLWFNFNGYWTGVAADHAMPELAEHLSPIPTGKVQPAEGYLSSVAFYESMVGGAREAGFDFVKVDNQARNLHLYRGTANAVSKSAQNSQALEVAAARHMDGLINCMAHNALCLFNTRISAITRCSEDYKAGDLPNARRHLHNSYANIPLLGQTVWGDHDMFHSNDEISGKMMAVSKAVSGGPVYVSDHPKRFKAEYIWPLCYHDGELIRPLAPAAPLAECLILDPFADGKPFVVIAPLANRTAALVAYNLTEPEIPVNVTVRPDHYSQASSMIQPVEAPWDLPKEGLLFYDAYAGMARQIRDEESFVLERFSDRLMFLCPIRNGWSVIGRTDKYLSPSTVQIVLESPMELLLEVAESGPITIWNRDGEVSADSYPCHSMGGGLWRVDLPEQHGSRIVRLQRK
jgi:hypothetical protein